MEDRKLCVVVVGKTFPGLTNKLLIRLLNLPGISGVVRVISSTESANCILRDKRLIYAVYESVDDLLNIDMPGYNTRHIQRKSVDEGIRTASNLGFTHVLKLRSDFLVTTIDVQRLYEKYNSLPQVYGLIFPGWRFRSCKIDLLSSFPDLWVFGSLTAMQLLYSMENICQNNLHFVPASMSTEFQSIDWHSLNSRHLQEPEPLIESIYDAHSELYAVWRERLRIDGVHVSHENLYGNFLLIADEAVRYFWINPSKKLFILRPKERLSEHKWWDKNLLAKGIKPIRQNPGWNETNVISVQARIKFKLKSAVCYIALAFWLSKQSICLLYKRVEIPA